MRQWVIEPLLLLGLVAGWLWVQRHDRARLEAKLRIADLEADAELRRRGLHAPPKAR
jgi:hypothetical protein